MGAKKSGSLARRKKANWEWKRGVQSMKKGMCHHKDDISHKLESDKNCTHEGIHSVVIFCRPFRECFTFLWADIVSTVQPNEECRSADFGRSYELLVNTAQAERGADDWYVPIFGSHRVFILYRWAKLSKTSRLRGRPTVYKIRAKALVEMFGWSWVRERRV